MRLQTSTVAVQVTYSVIAQRVLPKSKCFWYNVTFQRSRWTPSYSQRSCYIPKHLGKHSSKPTKL